MADPRGRAPLGRLQANTRAKEGTAVSPPAKAPVNRTAGPALQVCRPTARVSPVSDSISGNENAKRSVATTADRASAEAKTAAAFCKHALHFTVIMQASRGEKTGSDRPARPAIGKSRFAPAALKIPEPQHADAPASPAEQHPAGKAQQQQQQKQVELPAQQPAQQQQQVVRIISPPSRLPSPLAASPALETPTFAGFQSRLPRRSMTPAAAATTVAADNASASAGSPETPAMLLWRSGGCNPLATPAFALSTATPSSATSGDATAGVLKCCAERRLYKCLQ